MRTSGTHQLVLAVAVHHRCEYIGRGQVLAAAVRRGGSPRRAPRGDGHLSLTLRNYQTTDLRNSPWSLGAPGARPRTCGSLAGVPETCPTRNKANETRGSVDRSVRRRVMSNGSPPLYFVIFPSPCRAVGKRQTMRRVSKNVSRIAGYSASLSARLTPRVPRPSACPRPGTTTR